MAYYRSNYSKTNKPKSKTAYVPGQPSKRPYQSPAKASKESSERPNATNKPAPVPQRAPPPRPRPAPKPKLPAIVVSKEKDLLIRSLQVRWWYVIPDWPDPDSDYASAVHSLPLVDKDWDKVKAVTGFPGLFQDQRGVIYDLRDQSTCPTYRNLAEKTESELEMLLLAALQNQVAQLRAQQDYDPALARKLEERAAALLSKDAGEKMETGEDMDAEAAEP